MHALWKFWVSLKKLLCCKLQVFFSLKKGNLWSVLGAFSLEVRHFLSCLSNLKTATVKSLSILSPGRIQSKFAWIGVFSAGHCRTCIPQVNGVQDNVKQLECWKSSSENFILGWWVSLTWCFKMFWVFWKKKSGENNEVIERHQTFYLAHIWKIGREGVHLFGRAEWHFCSIRSSQTRSSRTWFQTEIFWTLCLTIKLIFFFIWKTLFMFASCYQLRFVSLPGLYTK